MQQSDWIGTSQTARLLGVSAETVRLWANKGQLKPLMVDGGRRVFSRYEVETLRAEREAAADAARIDPELKTFIDRAVVPALVDRALKGS